jgi:hypothetical protein
MDSIPFLSISLLRKSQFVHFKVNDEEVLYLALSYGLTYMGSCLLQPRSGT